MGYQEVLAWAILFAFCCELLFAGLRNKWGSGAVYLARYSRIFIRSWRSEYKKLKEEANNG